MAYGEYWKCSFVWIPEYVKDGNPKQFGWRWLVFGWYIVHDSWDGCYSVPTTGHLDWETMVATGVFLQEI